MHVQSLNRNKNNINNVFSTLLPLSCVLKMFGLYCISWDGKKLKYSWPIWRVSFVSITLFFFNSVRIYYALIATKIKFQNYFVLLSVLAYFQYVVDITYVYKYGRQRCLNYYKVFKCIDDVIGMPYCYQIKRSITKKSIFFVIIYFIFIVGDIYPLLEAYGWLISIFYSIDYVCTAFKMFSALDGIAHFTQINFRLKRIKDILEDFYSTAQTLPGVTMDVICKNNWTTTSNRVEPMSTLDHNIRTNVIVHLSRCYLLLLQQCDYINGMFGFRILLGSFVFLLEMVMLINLIVRLTLGTMIPFYKSIFFSLLPTILKITIYCLVLVVGMYCCEQTYKQNDRIIRCIDHLMTNKKITSKSYEALQELRDLVISRPISFNAVNFYTLNYSSLLAMASAIITYTIILLQNI